MLFQDVNHFSENLDDEEADVISSSNEVPSLQSLAVGFSPDETILLNEQLRKHVQLLTIMHLITAQQSGLEEVTGKCKLMLQELVPLKQRVDIAI